MFTSDPETAGPIANAGARIISYGGGGGLVAGSTVMSAEVVKEAGEIADILGDVAEAVQEAESHKGLFSLPFSQWPGFVDWLSLLTMYDVIGFIGAAGVMVRLYIDLKSRGKK